MLQPPFYLPSKVHMVWVIHFHPSHRLFSCLINHSTVSWTILLGNWVFLGGYFKQFSLLFCRCKQKQRSGWDGHFNLQFSFVLTIISRDQDTFQFCAWTLLLSLADLLMRLDTTVPLPYRKAYNEQTTSYHVKPLIHLYLSLTVYTTSYHITGSWWQREVQCTDFQNYADRTLS